MFNTNDFKNYRTSLGFNNAEVYKKFLSAKDIEPQVDFNYINDLNFRLVEIFNKINGIFYKPNQNLENFLEINLRRTYEIIKNNGILNRLTNQGRRKEEVYFSWMRDFLICEYFKPALCDIFDIEEGKIIKVGDDDFSDLQTFKRTPKADLQIDNYLIEIQSGFQGINDIKEHKVRQAKLEFAKSGVKTFVIHFDLFNWQVAFVDISEINDNDLNWVTRQQMEGQSVLNIDQNYFIWFLTQEPMKIDKILRYLTNKG